MNEPSPALLELARRYGVAAEFDDWTGRRTAVAESTLVAVLEALGRPVESAVGSRPSQGSGRRNSASKRVDLAFIAPDDGRKRHGQSHSRRHRWIDRG